MCVKWYVFSIKLLNITLSHTLLQIYECLLFKIKEVNGWQMCQFCILGYVRKTSLSFFQSGTCDADHEAIQLKTQDLSTITAISSAITRH